MTIFEEHKTLTKEDKRAVKSGGHICHIGTVSLDSFNDNRYPVSVYFQGKDMYIKIGCVSLPATHWFNKRMYEDDEVKHVIRHTRSVTREWIDAQRKQLMAWIKANRFGEKARVRTREQKRAQAITLAKRRAKERERRKGVLHNVVQKGTSRGSST